MEPRRGGQERIGDILKRIGPAMDNPVWQEASKRVAEGMARGETFLPPPSPYLVGGLSETYDEAGNLLVSKAALTRPLPGEKPFWQSYLDRYWRTFRDARMSDDPEDFQRQFREALTAGRGLYICGPTGVGKTHLAVGIFAELAGRGYSDDVALVSAPDMMELIQADFDLPADQRNQARYFETVAVLLVDDIGRGRATAWAVSTVCNIVEHRVRNGRLTYFTSNWAREELGQFFDRSTGGMDGERLASRIAQLCVEYVYDGPDRRRQGR